MTALEWEDCFRHTWHAVSALGQREIADYAVMFVGLQVDARITNALGPGTVYVRVQPVYLPGSDGIPGCVLKFYAEALCKPLLRLFFYLWNLHSPQERMLSSSPTIR